MARLSGNAPYASPKAGLVGGQQLSSVIRIERNQSERIERTGGIATERQREEHPMKRMLVLGQAKARQKQQQDSHQNGERKGQTNGEVGGEGAEPDQRSLITLFSRASVSLPSPCVRLPPLPPRSSKTVLDPYSASLWIRTSIGSARVPRITANTLRIMSERIA